MQRGCCLSLALAFTMQPEPLPQAEHHPKPLVPQPPLQQPRPPRLNLLAPLSSNANASEPSSAPTSFCTAGKLTSSRSAARAKLPSSQEAMKYSMALSLFTTPVCS